MPKTSATTTAAAATKSPAVIAAATPPFRLLVSPYVVAVPVLLPGVGQARHNGGLHVG